MRAEDFSARLSAIAGLSVDQGGETLWMRSVEGGPGEDWALAI